jgi:hypothetical protein
MRSRLHCRAELLSSSLSAFGPRRLHAAQSSQPRAHSCSPRAESRQLLFAESCQPSAVSCCSPSARTNPRAPAGVSGMCDERRAPHDAEPRAAAPTSLTRYG